MAKLQSSILEPARTTGVKKQTVMVSVFAGIDRSTWRARIEGKGQRLYETKNVFPYIQGKLLRRRDAVETNSRDSNNAFPSFPAETLTGNPVIKKVLEFNDTICILYEDDGDTGKLLMDAFDPGANTLTNRIALADNRAFTAGGLADAVPYQTIGATAIYLFIDRVASKGMSVTDAWVQGQSASGVTGAGVCTTFLQAYFHLNNANFNTIGRTAPGLAVHDTVTYTLTEDVGEIMRLISFGYQTSSAGATTVLLAFKPSSIWVLTGIGATESFEQITGNIGLAGKNAITYTPFGICLVGRDTDGLLNLYLLDRNSLVLHTIGHELYEELNDIPKANYDDIVVSFHRNRMVRIAITKTGDAVANNQEYWMDFYNGLKKRTLWGPNPLPASNILNNAISFSGGNNPVNSGFFMLLKEGTTYKIYEDIDTDTYNSTDSEWDDQVWRTKMYDFGRYYGIIDTIIIVARANGAKFKVYYEEPKLAGDDNDTTQTLIGSYQMGTGGANITKPIRIVPAILKNQVGIKVESDYDSGDNEPLEISQIGFEYEVTQRQVIE